MARFDVHELKTRGTVPLVVDVQADLLSTLRSRVVIPLLPLEHANHEVAAHLKPVVDIAGLAHVLMTTDLGSLPVSALGRRVDSLEDHRQTIVDALDFLFQGF